VEARFGAAARSFLGLGGDVERSSRKWASRDALIFPLQQSCSHVAHTPVSWPDFLLPSRSNRALGAGGREGQTGLGGGDFVLGTFRFDDTTVTKKKHAFTSNSNTDA
jgi:hypothetical protein